MDITNNKQIPDPLHAANTINVDIIIFKILSPTWLQGSYLYRELILIRIQLGSFLIWIPNLWGRSRRLLTAWNQQTRIELDLEKYFLIITYEIDLST